MPPLPTEEKPPDAAQWQAAENDAGRQRRQEPCNATLQLPGPTSKKRLKRRQAEGDVELPLGNRPRPSAQPS